MPNYGSKKTLTNNNLWIIDVNTEPKPVKWYLFTTSQEGLRFFAKFSLWTFLVLIVCINCNWTDISVKLFVIHAVFMWTCVGLLDKETLEQWQNMCLSYLVKSYHHGISYVGFRRIRKAKDLLRLFSWYFLCECPDLKRLPLCPWGW